MSFASFKGRYQRPVPTTNLMVNEEDFDRFEQLDDDSDFMPRAPPPGVEALSVVGVNTRQDLNEGPHNTHDYVTNQLVVRRGQQFTIDVTFNRPLTPQDDFQVEFLIGSDPSPNKGSLVVVTFGNRPGGSWTGQIVGAQGPVTSLGITPNPRAIVGLYRLYVAVSVGSSLQRTDRNPATDLYVLFNPWCPNDDVFYPDDAGRYEYVLNSTGLIYQGTNTAVTERGWVYGQFEAGVLDACIYILDTCRMPIDNRDDVIKIVRTASAMINSQDDNGVLVGNWGEDFSMGTAPTSWTGSSAILLQYHNTGAPVSFAQCWVYAAVLNTFLRCLGIPTRLITNFNSAHDNNGNLKIELIFKADGSPDRRNTRDSIWNYHCWNEAFMKRSDLPTQYSGWQVVDATPQETSDGYFRCGPAAIAAVKEGDLCYPFDSGFVFAEVNSDVIYLKSDRYGNMTPFRVDTAYTGILMYTKAVGSWSPEDITHNYKYPEGSPQDKQSMARAEQYGCQRDHSDVPAGKLTLDITSESTLVGQPVRILVTFYNQSELHKTAKAHIEVSMVYYTGVVSEKFWMEDFTLQLEAFHNNSAMFEVKPQDYIKFMGSKAYLHIVVTGQSDTETTSQVKVVSLKPPPVSIVLSGQPQLNREMYVTVSFRNTLNMMLHNAKMMIEGAGLMDTRVFNYSTIGPFAEVSQKVRFIPRKPGVRTIVALLDCQNLPEATSMVEVRILQ
ncbi:coagulation factor XIII A chain [Nothobranchius furzeri]|uniref:protein-glutamine gamma-glutamyltransferase n=1 Tax=Nothobranchius furzeri TaxID=105023 RepID=A0A1A8AQH1_NOTFU|nr:coagulation factor XIII A chain [Nothobranchius furzeri]